IFTDPPPPPPPTVPAPSSQAPQDTLDRDGSRGGGVSDTIPCTEWFDGWGWRVLWDGDEYGPPSPPHPRPHPLRTAHAAKTPQHQLTASQATSGSNNTSQFMSDSVSAGARMEAAMALQAARGNFPSTAAAAAAAVAFSPSSSASSTSSAGASTSSSASSFFRDESANMATSLMRPTLGQEFFQGHMLAGSSHTQGTMNLQQAQPFYHHHPHHHYGTQGLHPYYMPPR
ncbi:hypothetical protein Pcinc_019656, partial [Petrolisthes cinctipes]